MWSTLDVRNASAYQEIFARNCCAAQLARLLLNRLLHPSSSGVEFSPSPQELGLLLVVSRGHDVQCTDPCPGRHPDISAPLRGGGRSAQRARAPRPPPVATGHPQTSPPPPRLHHGRLHGRPATPAPRSTDDPTRSPRSPADRGVERIRNPRFLQSSLLPVDPSCLLLPPLRRFSDLTLIPGLIVMTRSRSGNRDPFGIPRPSAMCHREVAAYPVTRADWNARRAASLPDLRTERRDRSYGGIESPGILENKDSSYG